jgi:hypothetical protein
MELDAPSKVIAPLEDESDESDESDKSVQDDRKPFQFFGTKCANWDDVVAVLQERPQLLENFLFLYRKLLKYLPLTFSADAEALEPAGYFTLSYGLVPIIIDKTMRKLRKKWNHDFIGANLMKALSDVEFPTEVHWYH